MSTSSLKYWDKVLSLFNLKILPDSTWYRSATHINWTREKYCRVHTARGNPQKSNMSQRVLFAAAFHINPYGSAQSPRLLSYWSLDLDICGYKCVHKVVHVQCCAVSCGHMCCGHACYHMLWMAFIHVASWTTVDKCFQPVRSPQSVDLEKDVKAGQSNKFGSVLEEVNEERRMLNGVVALLVECRTCDQEVMASTLDRACSVKTLGKFFTPMCLCSPSSIRWYRPKGGDALRLGSKGRYGSCVGGR